jgi:hypothetical protein
MRKSIVILGACLVLVLGMTGCDDDDDVFNVPDVPIDQQVTAVTQAVVAGITTVTAIANVINFPTSATALGGGCTDVSKACLGGGFAELCDQTILNIVACDIPGIGVIDGNPNPAASIDIFGNIVINLSIDNSFFLNGTLIIPFELGGCATFGYENLTVDTQGVAATMNSSSVSQCLGGQPDGTIFADVSAFGFQLTFFFNGEDTVTVEVFTSPKGAPTICSVNLLDGSTDCSLQTG